MKGVAFGSLPLSTDVSGQAARKQSEAEEYKNEPQLESIWKCCRCPLGYLTFSVFAYSYMAMIISVNITVNSVGLFQKFLYNKIVRKMWEGSRK